MMTRLFNLFRKILKLIWLILWGSLWFIRNYFGFMQVQRRNNPRFPVRWYDLYPVVDENTQETLFDPHYIYFPAWAARIIARNHPDVHVDISSTLSFCSLLSAFIPVLFFDYRPAHLELSGLVSGHADLQNLPFESNSISSLSCMHVIEHIGLGRYGDQLDPEGDLKAIAELKRVIKPEGSLFLVTPVGKPRIQFNAHRIYTYEQIADQFAGFEIRQFAMINDNGKFSIASAPQLANQQRYGCGCWWFVKKQDE